MQANLSEINCEFIARPWIAVSKFANTVPSNMNYLQESAEISDKTSMNRFFQKLQIYEQSMRVLNTKAENGSNKYCYYFLNPNFNGT